MTAPQDPSTLAYRFDPNLGEPGASYTSVDFRRTHRHRAEVQARFVAHVSGETLIRTLHGHQAVRWQAEPGTPCFILGYWSDGTVHLRWPAIGRHYRIDGRFPGWVVVEEQNPATLRDPYTLPASPPHRVTPPALAPRVLFALFVLVAIAGIVGLVVAASGGRGGLFF